MYRGKNDRCRGAYRPVVIFHKQEVVKDSFDKKKIIEPLKKLAETVFEKNMKVEERIPRNPMN